LKLDFFILITLVYSAELLTDFSYTNFTVGLSNVDALDRLRVHLNIILFQLIFVVSQKDHKNCRIQLLVVVNFCKLKQNGKTDDDDDAVHKLCSQSSQSADC